MNIEEVKSYIQNSSETSSVYVGCDSHKSSKNKVLFVTVVVIHIDSYHGGKIFSKRDVFPVFSSNRQRLLKEVELALDVAYPLIDVVGNRQFELHLDLSQDPVNFSNTVVTEAQGWVRGMGLSPIIKPDSWAASACADHFANE